MRDYGRVYSSFWQSQDTRGFSDDGRVLALYLLTSPHANLLGCYWLPDAYAAEDMKWSSERVTEGFAELQAKGYLTRDEATKWVFIHKYLEWNTFENANVAKAAKKAVDQVPKTPLKAKLAAALLEFGQHMDEPFRKALETLREAFANPEPEPNQNQSPNQTQAGTGTLFADPPAEAPAPPPAAPAAAPTPAPAPKPAKPAKAAAEPKPTVETWNAYSAAYETRYGQEPVRNAVVNGQLAQVVGRLGAEEAPEVARFFVTHNNVLYVRAMHPVNLLLRDAEKLRTEWATGRQVTHAQAVQVDRTQTNGNAFAGMLAEARAREATHG